MKKQFIIKTLNSTYTLTQDSNGYRVTKIEGRTSKSAYMVQKILVEPYVLSIPKVNTCMHSLTPGAWRTSLVQEVTQVKQPKTFVVRLVVVDDGSDLPVFTKEQMANFLKDEITGGDISVHSVHIMSVVEGRP